MQNMSRLKQQKIVEISFDPESQDQFPNLSQKSMTNKNTRSSRKPKTKDDPSSPTSSHGDSVISAVTRAEFETLSQGISKMGER